MPRPLVAAATGVVAGTVVGVVPWTWPGVAAQVLVVLAVGAGAARWSRRAGWHDRHVAALGAGALLSLALLAVLTEPIGDVTAPAKYVHNACAATGVVVVGYLACRARPADAQRPA